MKIISSVLFFSGIRFLLKFQWFREKRKLVFSKIIYNFFSQISLSSNRSSSLVTSDKHVQIYNENFEEVRVGFLTFLPSKRKK